MVPQGNPYNNVATPATPMLGNYSVYFFPVQYLLAMHYVYMVVCQVMYNVLTPASRKIQYIYEILLTVALMQQGKGAGVYFKCSPQHLTVCHGLASDPFYRWLRYTFILYFLILHNTVLFWWSIITQYLWGCEGIESFGIAVSMLQHLSYRNHRLLIYMHMEHQFWILDIWLWC